MQLPNESLELGNITLVLVFGLIFIGTGYLARRSEKRKWNNGICAKNNLKWEQFDTDSQGGRMYKAGDEYCSISWPLIDNA